MDDLARRVGERLRAARRDRGWSVGALAQTAGIGKGSLSEIENGVRNPTLSTLYALAGALGLPLSTLLAGQTGARVASPGVEALLLDVRESAGWTVEVYRLVLDPGAVHHSVPHGAGVVEHLLLTRGRARVGRAGEEVEIGTGEAAEWVSDVAHGYIALSEEPVESVLVIRTPGSSSPESSASIVAGATTESDKSAGA
ncbi:MAG TPA: helix-turn-helix domain-containing protein [Microlunatus sp.]|nr:helix-turn-helix domain-containing protein [Microlunatus sp.]